MEKKMLSKEELDLVAVGGFPNGEFPEGTNLCPRCGEKEGLTLLHETIVENTGNPTIESTLKDKTYRLFKCPTCGCIFWRYGNFYEFTDLS